MKWLNVDTPQIPGNPIESLRKITKTPFQSMTWLPFFHDVARRSSPEDGRGMLAGGDAHGCAFHRKISDMFYSHSE
jgi:hypothetical protein